MERREFQRVNVEVQGAFYVRNETAYLGDFAGMIKDVSEGGIRVEINDKQYDRILSMLEVGSRLEFQAFDEVKIYDKQVVDIFSGEISIVRKTNKDGTIILGCMIRTPEDSFNKYIKDKRTSIFLSGINNASE